MSVHTHFYYFYQRIALKRKQHKVAINNIKIKVTSDIEKNGFTAICGNNKQS